MPATTTTNTVLLLVQFLLPLLLRQQQQQQQQQQLVLLPLLLNTTTISLLLRDTHLPSHPSQHMASSDWRSRLGFSTRLLAVTKMQVKCLHCRARQSC